MYEGLAHTVEDCLTQVDNALANFGVALATDVVCQTTDRASVMEKMGRLSPTLHQLCYAHGLHLAELDVIYKKKSYNRPAEAHQSDETMNDSDDDVDELMTWMCQMGLVS